MFGDVVGWVPVIFKLISFYRTHFLTFAIAISLGGAVGNLDAIDFSGREKLESAVSDNGSVELKWEKVAQSAVELQQGKTAGFLEPKTRYTGSDAGSVITGLPEGVHFFRLREGEGAWSLPLRVEVKFFPLDKLFWLLGAGALVVLATMGTILFGAWRNREESAKKEDAP